VGLLLLALLSLPPLLACWRGDWADRFVPQAAEFAVAAAVLFALFGFIVWAAGCTRATLFAGPLAAILTGVHYAEVDSRPEASGFQRVVYRQVLSLGPGPEEVSVPHGYRPLGYGFTRSLELATGDWLFACLAYRWFFQFWFLWGAYRLASFYVTPGTALWAPVICAVYYPLSILHYSGQLTDPISHALFVLGLVWVVEDRRGLVLGAVGLGMLAKETAVLLIPAYLACNRKAGIRAVLWSAGFLAVAVAVLLAARLPLGWRPGTSLNGVDGTLLFLSNFAPDAGDYWAHTSLAERYLHPLAFIVPFLPLAMWKWQQTPDSLRALALTVPPLMIGVHVTMSWAHESRNYMPALPVLAALFIHALTSAASQGKLKSQTAGW
jgi:hypothetical protein